MSEARNVVRVRRREWQERKWGLGHQILLLAANLVSSPEGSRVLGCCDGGGTIALLIKGAETRYMWRINISARPWPCQIGFSLFSSGTPNNHDGPLMFCFGTPCVSLAYCALYRKSVVRMCWDISIFVKQGREHTPHVIYGLFQSYGDAPR